MASPRGSGSDSGPETDVAAVAADLGIDLPTVEAEADRARSAFADLEATATEVDDHGEAAVDEVAGAYRRASDLLDRYEEPASGTGRETFQKFVEFQGAFETLVEEIDEDLPGADAFEETAEYLDQRRLSVEDFERARELLGPAARYADLLDRRTDARDRLREARKALERAARELDAAIAELEELQALGEADLDAPVERLRDPITAYEEAVREAFATFRAESSAREVLGFVAATESYPLVDYRQPPPELLSYVESKPAGEEPIDTLLEYADYSPTKLDHYVADVGALRSTVAVHRTYLERLDADPLTIGWPPPDAGVLARRTDELVSVVGRFALEEVVAALRTVRALPRETDYERLRRSAEAQTGLDETLVARLRSGAVEDALAAARERRSAVDTALEETDPDRAGTGTGGGA
jgi:hypothetical protein